MAGIGKMFSRLVGGGNRRRSSRSLVGRDRDRRVLNMRVESKRTRQVRRIRALFRGGRLVLLAGTCLVAAFAVKAFVDRVYYENPTFELGKLYIETDGDLTRSIILRQSGIRRDDHLLDLDLDLVRSRIRTMPQVADVQVERQLPDIVSIRVRERVPVAWLECPLAGAIPHTPDGGWFIDARGRIFPCGSLADEHLDLPIIVANDLPPLIGRVEVDSGPIMDAVRLIDLNGERLFDEQLEISRIECAHDYSMIVTYRNDAAVVFGTRDLEGQFDDFAAILAFVKDQGRQIATLNLMVAENKPITFYEGPTSWEEMPILRASAMILPAGELEAGVEEGTGPGEENQVEAELPEIQIETEAEPVVVAAAPPVQEASLRQSREESPEAGAAAVAGSVRDRGADVRAIMGSLYE